MGCKRPAPPSVPFLEARSTFSTQLRTRGPAPQDFEPLLAEGPLEVVTYASGSLSLRGYLALPESDRLRSSAGLPLLLYLHGGFALDAGDVADCLPFLEAGFAVFAPAFRGENGNPGAHELLFGEVEDARAALEHIRQDPRIDRRRVVVFGHSVGGMLSALLSLYPGLEVADIGSIGGFYDDDFFDGLPIPFADTPEERRLRLAHLWVDQLAEEHFACVGRKDRWPRAVLESLKAPKLVVHTVPGDHHSSIEPCMRAFLRRAEARGLTASVGPVP